MVLKTWDLITMIDDLKETFKNLRKWKWKFNPN
jgi:hypothetical protein